MGALASHAQQADVAERVARADARRRAACYGERDGFAPLGEGVAEGAFFAPTLLLAATARRTTRCTTSRPSAR